MGCEPEHVETFMDLLRSPAHWYFELFLELLTGIVGAAVWPLIRRSKLAHWLTRRWFKSHECEDDGLEIRGEVTPVIPRHPRVEP